MSHPWESFKSEFQPYLQQFIDRARSNDQALTQIPIPTSLQNVCQQIGISLKTSFGMGTPTIIPWLACFIPGQSASVEGVYPVVLYRRDQSTLSVCYGVSATSQAAAGNWPKSWPNNITTGLQRFTHNKYGQSYVYEFFQQDQLTRYSEISDAFTKVISNFLDVYKGVSIVNPPLQQPTTSLIKPSSEQIPKTLSQLSKDFSSANLLISPQFLLRFVASLLTKCFTILTGLSGSGKTKLGHAFAEWISDSEDQYRLVAVGADWTSNENVLGYPDALREGAYRKPSSGALDLILHARNDKERPYFLILDEMNLSHVERYFADILSAIESGQQIALHSSPDDLTANNSNSLPVPPKIGLPKNLFIIGTVNIDETTYMFSPKVLDRANVIEFRATKADIETFLTSPARVNMAKLAGKGSGYGPDFVKMAAAEVAPSELPPEIADGARITEDLKDRLTEIFEKLAQIGAEFGFRTAIEISRFVFYHATLSGPGWDFKDALDAQVVQKLMPKLHGSDRKLRPTLEALKAFCTEYDLPLSLEKTNRMLERLKDGFTSFAEA